MRRAGDSGHRGEGGDFADNTSASGDEAVFFKYSATDDRRVGANGGAVADQCLANLILADNPGARVVHIGEHAGRAAGGVVLQRHALVDQDVVLDFRVVDDAGLLADPDIAQYVAEMPDAGALADLKPPLILNRILLAGCWLRSPSTLMVAPGRGSNVVTETANRRSRREANLSRTVGQSEDFRTLLHLGPALGRRSRALARSRISEEIAWGHLESLLCPVARGRGAG